MEPASKRPRLPEDLHLHVSLPSGRSASVTLPRSARICELKVAAQKALGQRFLQLIGPKGQLDPGGSMTLQELLRDGDDISAVAMQPQVAASKDAFALWCAGSSKIVTWGVFMWDDPVPSKVEDPPCNVQHIVSTEYAFAALLADGHVCTWGLDMYGDDVGNDIHKVNNGHVKRIVANEVLFAAVLANGRVTTWSNGWLSGRVQDRLRDVQEIFALGSYFGFTLADGACVFSGIDCDAFPRHSTKNKLRHVKKVVQSHSSIFAALQEDGHVEIWDVDPPFPEFRTSRKTKEKLKNVQEIYSNQHGGFAALLADRSVVTWGNPESGGRSGRGRAGAWRKLENVQQIYKTSAAFAALLTTGEVVTWGDPERGHDKSKGVAELTDVQDLYATKYAFCAVLKSGRVHAWGDPKYGGNAREVQDQLHDVQEVYANEGAFAAILADRSVVVWGDAKGGGSCQPVAEQLEGKRIQRIHSASRAFVAIATDGSVISWGHPLLGGDSSAVQDDFDHV